MARTFAVVTGGGTAGHVLPALAVAEALVATGRERSSIVFVGSTRGMEAELIPPAGFETVLLPGRGLVRSFDWSNLAAAAGMLTASGRAVRLLRRRRPEVVVSLGGYAGFACSAAAAVTRVPLVVVNPDAVAGAANRAVARFASACAVGFEGTGLPRAVVTGAPIRPEIEAVSRERPARAAARQALGLPPGRLVLGVFGGSLGSRRINEAVAGLVPAWSDRGDLAVHHVVGRRDWAELAKPVAPALRGGIHYQAVPFEDRMDLLYAVSDVIVSRAGALTVAELSAVGVPSVLVPLPGAPGDHQSANARWLVRAGAATLLEDAVCTPSGLAEALAPLLGDDRRRARMEEAARAAGHPDATARVASLVQEVAAGRSRDR